MWERVKPNEHELPMIRDLSESIKVKLQPASEHVLARALDELVEYFTQCGFRMGPGAMRFYDAALKDLPPDLLELAITRTIAQHDGGWTPKPGEIRARVTEDLAGRQLLLRQAEMAIARAEGRI